MNPNSCNRQHLYRDRFLPADHQSWEDAVEFCERLSQHTGQQYRLPTEAEWEYAARAGTTTPFHFGETLTPQLANYRWDHLGCYGLELPHPLGENWTLSPVGAFGVANAFGLYDVHGNTWEWCEDWHEPYQGALNHRPLRSGGVQFAAAACRCGSRRSGLLSQRLSYYSFRVVCVYNS